VAAPRLPDIGARLLSLPAEQQERATAVLEEAVEWVESQCGPFGGPRAFTVTSQLRRGVVFARTPALLSVASVTADGDTLTVDRVDLAASLVFIDAHDRDEVVVTGQHGYLPADYPAGEPAGMRRAAVRLFWHWWEQEAGLDRASRPDGRVAPTTDVPAFPQDVLDLVASVPGSLPGIA
jgi:hypothetical protein